MPVERLDEDEQAIALKSSKDTSLEEQGTHVASFIYESVPSALPIFLFLLISLSFLGLIILMFAFLGCLQRVYSQAK